MKLLYDNFTPSSFTHIFSVPPTKVKSHADSANDTLRSYWEQVGALLLQADGIYDGYAHATAASPPLTKEQVWCWRSCLLRCFKSVTPVTGRFAYTTSET